MLLLGNGSSFTMSSGSIRDCHADGVDGGAVLAADGASAQLYGVTIASCTADYGGALYALHATLGLARVDISDCQADTASTGGDKKHGGALFAYGSTLTIMESHMTRCSAFDGGCMYLAGATVARMEGTNISHGRATDGGGGMHVTGRSSLLCAACSISESYAREGGGILIDYEAQVELRESSIVHSCTTLTKGGGIYAGMDSALRVIDSTIRDSYALPPRGNYPTHGGCLMINFGGSAEMVRSDLRGCTAVSGGCIAGLSVGSRATIRDSRLQDCTADLQGGAMHALHAKLSLDNTIVAGASAPEGGGIFAQNAEVDVSGSRFLDVTAVFEGGTFYLSSDATLRLVNSSIERSTAPTGGVASLVKDTSVMVVEDAKIANCSASSIGAAVALVQGARFQATLLDITLPCASDYSSGLLSRKTPTSEPVSVSVRGLTVTPLGCASTSNSSPLPSILDGVTLPTCADATLPDFSLVGTLERDVPICAPTATCVDVPAVGVECVCALPSFPKLGTLASMAPYLEVVGCVTPVIAESVTLTRNEVTLVLQKELTSAEEVGVSLALSFNGTDDTAYEDHRWRVANADDTPSWLTLPKLEGNISGSRMVLISLIVGCAGLLDNSLNEWTILLRTDTHATTDLPVRIRVFVRAAAVASASTIILPMTDVTHQSDQAVGAPDLGTSTVLGASVLGVVAYYGMPWVFTLTARDFEGLPLDHGGDAFGLSITTIGAAPTDASTSIDGVVQYVRGANYSVRLTPTRVGEFSIRLNLAQADSCCRQIYSAACCAQAAAGSSVLPLATTLLLTVICPAGQAPFPSGDTCGCKPGREMIDGACSACEIGTFKEEVGNSRCQLCGGVHETTHGVGANSSVMCLCELNYFRSASGVCAPCEHTLTPDGRCVCGLELYDAANGASTLPDCLACPMPGTACDAPSATLVALPLAAGFWRTSRSSDDPRRCPDASKGSASGCIGGSGAQCKPGLTGALCTQCNETQGWYYSESESTCLHCKGSSTAVLITLLVLVAILAVGSFACLTHRAIHMVWSASQLSRRLLSVQGSTPSVAKIQPTAAASASAPPSQITSKLSIGSIIGAQNGQPPPGSFILVVAKHTASVRQFLWPLLSRLKIVWSFYQVVSLSPRIYRLGLPLSVAAVLDDLSVVFGFDMSSLMPSLSCVGMGGFFAHLLLVTLLPLILMLLSPLWGLWCALSLPTTGPLVGRVLASETFYLSLPLLLRLSFITLPIASSTAFAAFECEAFDDGSRLLIADYAIDCNSAEWQGIATWAGLAILLHAIAIPALSFWLVIRSAADPVLEAVLSFETAAFEPRNRAWGSAETLTKLLLVGVARVHEPGTLQQIFVSTVIALVMLTLILSVKPYRDLRCQFLAVASAFALVCFFLIATAFKFAQLNDSVEHVLSANYLERFRIGEDVLTVFLVIIVFSIFAALGTLLLYEQRAEREARHRRERESKARRLRWAVDDREVELGPPSIPPNLPPPHIPTYSMGGVSDRFHIFLSHVSGRLQPRPPALLRSPAVARC